MNAIRRLAEQIQDLIDLVDWHRLKWFAVLAIGLVFVTASATILAVHRDPFAFVAIAFGLVMAAMAVHELWPWLIEGRPTAAEIVLQHFPGPVTLRTPWRRLVFLLVSTILFGACLGAVALNSDMSAIGTALLWLGAIGCTAAVPVFLLMLFRGSALRLEADGFQIVHAGRRSVHRWSDTSEFSVADVGIPMVMFDEAALTGGMLAEFNRSITGRIGGLPDTYGMDAWSLAALMNEWRARALASQRPPAQSRPAP